MKLKKLYSVKTKNSDGSYKHQFYISFEQNEEESAKLFEKELNSKSKVDYLLEEEGKSTHHDGYEVTSESLEVNSEDEETLNGEDGNMEWEDSHNTDEFPMAWWLKKEFVAKDGTVFHKGEEVPEAYRTKPATDY